MKLTESMILEKRENKNFPGIATAWDGYEYGLKETRDFYENQKCETCRWKSKFLSCGQKVVPVGEDFGCNKWEPIE